MGKKVILISAIVVLMSTMVSGCGGETTAAPTPTEATGGRTNPYAGTTVAMYGGLRTPEKTRPSIVLPLGTSAAQRAATRAAEASAGGAAVNTSVSMVGLVTRADSSEAGSMEEQVLAGVETASKQLGFESNHLEAEKAADYQKNIDTLAADGYGAIIVVGSAMNDVVASAARKYTEIAFALVPQDGVGDSEPKIVNLTVLRVETDQAKAAISNYLQGLAKSSP